MGAYFKHNNRSNLLRNTNGFFQYFGNSSDGVSWCDRFLLDPVRTPKIIKLSGIEYYFLYSNTPLSLQIMVHTPEDFPDISRNYKIYNELNLSLRISVSVSHIKADVSLRRIDENVRNCFLYQLRSLKDDNLPLYRSNAEDNCYSKCRILTTIKMCNCTPYYFDVVGNESLFL